MRWFFEILKDFEISKNQHIRKLKINNKFAYLISYSIILDDLENMACHFERIRQLAEKSGNPPNFEVGRSLSRLNRDRDDELIKNLKFEID